MFNVCFTSVNSFELGGVTDIESNTIASPLVALTALSYTCSSLQYIDCVQ